ncbi:MAG: sodium-coupled permease [Planctomycetota bacterium]|nr:sodium-coupled permease [Planctomycetota bacterium]
MRQRSTIAVTSFLLTLLAGSVSARAAGPGMPAEQPGLHWLDWCVIVLYAAGTIALGVYFSKRQKSSDEYFTGGGNMNPLLIGVSLFATLLSTISYLGMPGESAGKGPVYFVGMLAHPITFLIVGYLMLPYYMKHRVTSAYELLEIRLGYQFRVLGALLFLLLRLIWMSVLLKFAGDAMVTMLDVDPSWNLLIVAIIGLVAIIYTSLGGLQAVVITDLIQTILLYGGALTVLAIVTWNFGGFSWIPTEWPSDWKSQPVFPESLATRVTWFGSILMTLVWYVATLGGDQTTVQRFMATRDAAGARKALLTQLIVGVVVGVTLCMVGIALMAHFHELRDSRPQQQKDEIVAYEQFNENFQAAKERYPSDEELLTALDWNEQTLDQTRDNLIGADQWFPRFISHSLPIGLAGLVIAAMFAAAMSSLDSGVNSITAVVMTDFVQRNRRQEIGERQHLLMSRGMAVAIGVIVVLGSMGAGAIEGNIMAVTQKSVNLFTTPIFALFYYSVFAKRVHPVGVWAGTIVGSVVAILVAFSGQICYWLHVGIGFDPATVGAPIESKMDALTGIPYEACVDPISFQWIGLFALVSNLVVGISLNYLLTSPSSESTTVE